MLCTLNQFLSFFKILYFINLSSSTSSQLLHILIELFASFSQAEIESRTELEQRLKEAEEALQELEKGLNCMERSTETEEQMKGNVTQLRSGWHHAHTPWDIIIL